jgi:hypothetical protein
MSSPDDELLAGLPLVGPRDPVGQQAPHGVPDRATQRVLDELLAVHPILQLLGSVVSTMIEVGTILNTPPVVP